MARLTISFNDRLKLEKQLKTSLERVVSQIGTEIRASLKNKTPVRTGRAQQGWSKRTKRGQDVAIQNRVPYVPFLEEGTSRMRAANGGRGIIGPALQEVKKKGSKIR